MVLAIASHRWSFVTPAQWLKQVRGWPLAHSQTSNPIRMSLLKSRGGSVRETTGGLGSVTDPRYPDRSIRCLKRCRLNCKKNFKILQMFISSLSFLLLFFFSVFLAVFLMQLSLRIGDFQWLWTLCCILGALLYLIPFNSMYTVKYLLYNTVSPPLVALYH